MSGDAEHFLGRLTPRGAAPPLRQRVLAAVAGELAAPPAPRGWRRAWLAVAASLLLSVALNVVVARVQEARVARVYGPRPVPQQAVDLARAVEDAAGPETAQWLQDRLCAAAWQRPVPPPGGM